MMKDWCLEVSGDYACFTRPEMKVERVSYDVMTPSSARAIFDAILWKPAIIWHVTKIDVLNPIKWISVRRNEVDTVASDRSSGIFIELARQQRAGLFLKDVRYRIYAWFEFIPPGKRKSCDRLVSCGKYGEFWADGDEQNISTRTDETEAKYAAMFERRVKKGQCFHRPYLGCREFACDFHLVEETGTVKAIDRTDDLGWMLYDINYEDPADPRPEFFRAKLKDGIVNTDRRNVEVRS
jgi:CRISPR-associated protein Cas5d